MWSIAKAYDLNMSVEDVHQLTKIDRWFLAKLHHIHRVRGSLKSMDFQQLSKHPELLREAKRCGFADRQIASQLLSKDEGMSIASPNLLCSEAHLGTKNYAGGR